MFMWLVTPAKRNTRSSPVKQILKAFSPKPKRRKKTSWFKF